MIKKGVPMDDLFIHRNALLVSGILVCKVIKYILSKITIEPVSYTHLTLPTT